MLTKRGCLQSSLSKRRIGHAVHNFSCCIGYFFYAANVVGVVIKQRSTCLIVSQ